jgi:50S ribosomal protein L16 3-hydroxylase
VPSHLLVFAQAAVINRLAEPQWLERALGETLTELKPRVWFTGSGQEPGASGVRLSPRSKMLYDAHHIFINGQALQASGRDATLMRGLADEREISAANIRRLSLGARDLLGQWLDDGWVLGAMP